MGWRDEALDKYLPRILDLLRAQAHLDDGVAGAGAFFYDRDGNKVGLSLASIASSVLPVLKEMKGEFLKNKENWKFIKLNVEKTGAFSLEFNYDEPFHWQVHQFPKTRRSE